MNTQEVQNCLILVNLIVMAIVTICLQVKSERHRKKEFLDKQLIKLQEMSFNCPFLEDEDFTKKWLQMQQDKNTLSIDDKNRLLKYDVYTEMLFNFILMSLDIYKTERKLLSYVDFKSWVRNHKMCWQNPLQAHSNREVYGKAMYEMVEDWLK